MIPKKAPILNWGFFYIRYLMSVTQYVSKSFILERKIAITGYLAHHIFGNHGQTNQNNHRANNFTTAFYHHM